MQKKRAIYLAGILVVANILGASTSALAMGSAKTPAKKMPVMSMQAPKQKVVKLMATSAPAKAKAMNSGSTTGAKMPMGMMPMMPMGMMPMMPMMPMMHMMPMPSTQPAPVVYLSKASAVVDNSGSTSFSATVDASVTSVEIYKDTVKLADAIVAAGKATAVINSGVAAGNVLTIKSFVAGDLKSTDTVTATQAGPTIVYISNASAVVDSMGMADFIADVDASVTKVEIYKGTTKLADATITAGTATVTINSGVAVGDVLSVKAYVGTTVQATITVTAQ